jgi:hypothetical protein
VSNQVWVCGEVLIDLIPDGTERKAVVGVDQQTLQRHYQSLGSQHNLLMAYQLISMVRWH